MLERFAGAARLALAWIAVAVIFAPDADAHDETGQARYLGNAGVAVTHGAHKILFDAFYLESYGQYALVNEKAREAMMNGAPPFSGVSALLVSHVHGDHFSAAPTLAYLRAQPDVRFFAASQVVDALLGLLAPDDPVRERMTGLNLVPGDAPIVTRYGDLIIEAVAVPHSGGERHAGVRNLVFRVTFEDRPSVLHLGDAAPSETVFSKLASHWEARENHVAFPPYWFLGDETGRRILRTHIRAKQVIGIHVPAAAEGNGDAWREKFQGDLFTDRGETREIRLQPLSRP